MSMTILTKNSGAHWSHQMKVNGLTVTCETCNEVLATDNTKPRVETYNLKASNGRHARIATKVIFSDGQVIEFMERMSKHEAIKQAEALRTR